MVRTRGFGGTAGAGRLIAAGSCKGADGGAEAAATVTGVAVAAEAGGVTIAAGAFDGGGGGCWATTGTFDAAAEGAGAGVAF